MEMPINTREHLQVSSIKYQIPWRKVGLNAFIIDASHNLHLSFHLLIVLPSYNKDIVTVFLPI